MEESWKISGLCEIKIFIDYFTSHEYVYVIDRLEL